ncbi:hypothetical protein C7T94_12560 [Pedobacter yulinensis]|uniref:Lipocalin-like domain-containing protein n=1 Tax=Pedobacter yulinensis TaxID=2126353 RepID=A0A2T3HN03_9SPHI|nr:hypothetical protein [Pedobacter yulinensis]PST83838.1 hypothetical protein C7T94_12560 [Pedobacter yulinensis]
MKKTVQLLSLLMIALVGFGSCKKDKDPATTDFFVGTYRGTVSYNDGTNNINSSDGKVTVTKVGSTSYKFFFGNNIPDITDVNFEKAGDNTYVSVGSGVTGITIDASSLKMLVKRGNQTWTANCTR